jgi:hypothetical protein
MFHLCDGRVALSGYSRSVAPFYPGLRPLCAQVRLSRGGPLRITNRGVIQTTSSEARILSSLVRLRTVVEPHVSARFGA